MMDATERFLENWSKLELELGDEPPWLRDARAEARKHFTTLGFPTTQKEAWKYTDVKPLTELAFELPDGNEADDAQVEAALTRWRLSGVALAVFVDGRWRPDLSHLDALPDTLRVESLRQALARDPSGIAEHLGRLVDTPKQAFTALNSALWRDGLVVQVPRGLAVKEPLQLLNLTTGARRPMEVQLRHLITLGEGAELRLIEHDIGLDGRPTFNNLVTEIDLAPNASLDRYTIEAGSRHSTLVSRVVARQARDARLRSHVFSLDGRFLRDDLESSLTAEGGTCTFNGLFLAADDHLVDHHTTIDHRAPHCTSRELYKGILTDKARGVFNGRVLVRQDAQGTDSQQQNKNLLLSRSAVINTKPQLEIWADDVQCTHGATIGQLDDEALFYLRARGIGVEEAKSMLLRAFAGELLDGVHFLPLRVQLEAKIEAHLTPERTRS